MNEFFGSLLVGGIAGCVVDLVLFPLDSIKTKIQNKQKLKFSLKEMYNGLSWSMAGSFPCASTFWCAFTISRLILLSFFSSSPVIDFFCALIASMSSSAIRCPFEVLKTQMISGKFQNSFDAPAAIIKQYGFFGLYSGFFALISREMPFDGIQMTLRSIFSGIELLNFSIGPFSVIGALAGGCTAFLTTPVDVVKTRIMADPEKFKTITATIRIILSSEGVAGLWRGWKIRVLMITIGGWVFFGTMDVLSKQIGLE